MFKKAAVFTDIHLGLKGNSKVHNDDCERFIDWYIAQAKANGCETGIFNKISDVKYDTEKGVIDSIKQLEFNESTKKYKLKTGGTKNRSVSKSRSNIDRLTKKKINAKV